MKTFASSSATNFRPKDESDSERRMREIKEVQLKKVELEGLEAQLAEKFPPVDASQWLTLPSEHGQRSWMTIAACGAIRHPHSGSTWLDRLRVSPHLRMIWKEFMEGWSLRLRHSHRNNDNLPAEDRFKD